MSSSSTSLPKAISIATSPDTDEKAQNPADIMNEERKKQAERYFDYPLFILLEEPDPAKRYRGVDLEAAIYNRLLWMDWRPRFGIDISETNINIHEANQSSTEETAICKTKLLNHKFSLKGDWALPAAELNRFKDHLLAGINLRDEIVREASAEHNEMQLLIGMRSNEYPLCITLYGHGNAKRTRSICYHHGFVSFILNKFEMMETAEYETKQTDERGTRKCQLAAFIRHPFAFIAGHHLLYFFDFWNKFEKEYLAKFHGIFKQ